MLTNQSGLSALGSAGGAVLGADSDLESIGAVYLAILSGEPQPWRPSFY
jgi:hypothetical protein